MPNAIPAKAANVRVFFLAIAILTCLKELLLLVREIRDAQKCFSRALSIHLGIRSRRVGGGDWKAVMSCRKRFEGYEASCGVESSWWNISPLSRAGYRNYLNDATSSWLPSPVTFWASVVRATLHLHDPSKPGANASRICSRARHSLVFTFASERPRTFAVSLILRCCTSHKIITTRYFPGRE